jgi:hypothetical protein
VKLVVENMNATYVGAWEVGNVGGGGCRLHWRLGLRT